MHYLGRQVHNYVKRNPETKMLDARTGSAMSDSQEVYHKVSEELARLLGGGAIDASNINNRLQEMDEFALVIALPALDAFIVALRLTEAQKINAVPVRHNAQLIDISEHSHHDKSQSAIPQQLSEQVGIYDVVESPLSLELPKIPVFVEQDTNTIAPLSDTAKRFLYKYFDNETVEVFSRVQVDALIDALVSANINARPASRLSAEQMTQNIRDYFDGKSDSEIAGGDAKKTKAVGVWRSNMFKTIKGHVGGEGLADILTKARASIENQTNSNSDDSPNIEENEVLSDLANHRARNFLKKLFKDERADLCTQAQALYALEKIKELYIPISRQKGSAAKQIQRLSLRFQGLTDTEVALLEDKTTALVSAGRFNLVKMITDFYTVEELQSVFEEIISDKQSEADSSNKTSGTSFLSPSRL